VLKKVSSLVSELLRTLLKFNIHLKRCPQMSIDRLPEKLMQIQKRIPLARGRGEEATKQALVLPFLDALGFDIWNPGEVCPEFEADFAIKKAGQKEKVDLAVLIDGEPRIFLEVKSIDSILDGHQGQLARYFNGVPTVSLAIITNGCEYRFYTDSGDPNLMDPAPFFAFRVDATDFPLDVLARFTRDMFSPTAIREYATELNYTTKLTLALRNELDLRSREPSDALVKWLLTAANAYEGRMVASVVDRFRPIVKNSLQTVLKEIVRRSVAALDEGVVAPEYEVQKQDPIGLSTPPQPVVAAVVAAPETISTKDESPGDQMDKGRIVTTGRELTAFAIVKGQFSTSALATSLIFDPSSKKEIPIELGYKDTTAYFNIYLNKPGWWVARLVIESKAPWLGLNLSPEVAGPLLPKGLTLMPPTAHAEVRVGLHSVEDLHSLNRVIFAAIQKTVDDRKAT
jgi:hypothetical protein